MTHCACPRDTATQRPRAKQRQRSKLAPCDVEGPGRGERGRSPDRGTYHAETHGGESVPSRHGEGEGDGGEGVGGRARVPGLGRGRGRGAGAAAAAATGGCGRWWGGWGPAPAQCGTASRWEREGEGRPSGPPTFPVPAVPCGLALPRSAPIPSTNRRS